MAVVVLVHPTTSRALYPPAKPTSPWSGSERDDPGGREGRFQLTTQHQHNSRTMQRRKGRLQGSRAVNQTHTKWHVKGDKTAGTARQQAD